MIVASFTLDEEKMEAGLHVFGHAGAGEIGHDIICASASILAYTLAQNIKMCQERGLLKYTPTIKLKNGNATIRCRAKDVESLAEIAHCFLVIQTGYQLLAHNHSEYVQVNMFGQD